MNNKKTILVTGANGQLGSEIKKHSQQYANYNFLFTNTDTFSLTDKVQMEAFIQKNKPDYCINCAAYTAVDTAETQTQLANQINHIGVGDLAKICSDNDVKLIHISTDYVFDGQSNTPIQENAITSPINVYGQTKLEGELACLQNNPDSIIIRTSWVYSEFGNNFVKTMIRLMQERESLNIINDQIGSPTYASDLAQVILTIISSKNWQSGIYHYSNEGQISWYQFAQDIKQIANLSCQLNPIPTTSYPTPAKRPNFSLLDKSKIKNTFAITVPHYLESLTTCIKKINA